MYRVFHLYTRSMRFIYDPLWMESYRLPLTLTVLTLIVSFARPADATTEIEAFHRSIYAARELDLSIIEALDLSQLANDAQSVIHRSRNPYLRDPYHVRDLADVPYPAANFEYYTARIGVAIRELQRMAALPSDPSLIELVTVGGNMMRMTVYLQYRRHRNLKGLRLRHLPVSRALLRRESPAAIRAYLSNYFDEARRLGKTIILVDTINSRTTFNLLGAYLIEAVCDSRARALALAFPEHAGLAATSLVSFAAQLNTPPEGSERLPIYIVPSDADRQFALATDVRFDRGKYERFDSDGLPVADLAPMSDEVRALLVDPPQRRPSDSLIPLRQLINRLEKKHNWAQAVTLRERIIALLHFKRIQMAAQEVAASGSPWPEFEACERALVGR